MTVTATKYDSDSERLYCDAVDVKPVHHEWGFQDFESGTDELVYPSGGWDDDEEEEVLESIIPMMNYYYPLPNHNDITGRLDHQQRLLLDFAGNVVLVLVNDEPVLALTGGGMDFSWEICHAYILLGYYPPVHFCKLPRMADKNSLDPKDARIIAGCRRSLEIMANWIEDRQRHLGSL